MSLARQVARNKIRNANGNTGFAAIREAARMKKIEAIKAKIDAQKKPVVKEVAEAPKLEVKEIAKRVKCSVCGKLTTAKSGVCAACQKVKKEA